MGKEVNKGLARPPVSIAENRRSNTNPSKLYTGAGTRLIGDATFSSYTSLMREARVDTEELSSLTRLVVRDLFDDFAGEQILSSSSSSS